MEVPPLLSVVRREPGVLSQGLGMGEGLALGLEVWFWFGFWHRNGLRFWAWGEDWVWGLHRG